MLYTLTQKKITEISETNPKTHHGIMHLLREGIVKNYLNKKNMYIKTNFNIWQRRYPFRLWSKSISKSN